MSFDSLGLAEPLLRAIHEQGYTTPTPIQAQAIPAVLNGGDLLAGAQTGTGKTAGFTLPMLHRLSHRRPRCAMPRAASHPRADPHAHPRTRRAGRRKRAHLRQVPVAQQHGDVRRRRHAARRSTSCARASTSSSPRPAACSTTHQQRTLDLSHIEIFVLDEADRMLDMGFVHDIKKVLAVLPPRSRACCSRPPSATRSRRWPTAC
jgi:ATP-dependent RNA helicase RhlE